MRTYSVKPSEINREWYVVDADGLTLGRMSCEVAKILRGKHKPQYTPHMDTGDFVIVVNAEKIKMTGDKMNQKVYYHHSGYLGGLKEKPLAKVMAEHPEEAVFHAVKGMLPHNKLGRVMFKKLKVYAGADHPHEAQDPKILSINSQGVSW